jgi:tRNA-binding protein
LTIDFEKLSEFGKHQPKLKRYSKEDLINRQIVAVVNFPKKQIGNFMSECLILGAVGESGDVIYWHLILKFKTDYALASRFSVNL